MHNNIFVIVVRLPEVSSDTIPIDMVDAILILDSGATGDSRTHFLFFGKSENAYYFCKSGRK